MHGGYAYTIKKADMIKEAEHEVIDVQKQYGNGLITQGERYNKVIDIWANVTEKNSR